MIRRTLGETIDVEISSSPDVWMTRADPNQLETALLNLVVNARDAMPSGGRLTIETANAPSRTAATTSPRANTRCLRLANVGFGIPADVLPKVFEPFFTTKDTGRGSGLGLSMVYGFVTQSGGHVRIASTAAEGTCVRIYLPRASATDAAAITAGRIASSAASALDEPVARARAGESILVVEDNVDVRRLGVAALEQLGYRVLQAPDGHSALRLLDDNVSLRVDAVFSDVVLPGGLSGPDLVDRIRCSRPGIPALFTSGYTRDSVGAHPRVTADRRVLMKPYRIEALASAIRRTIDESH